MSIGSALRMFPPERHSAFGPSSVAEHVSKVAASLASLCELDAPPEEWLVGVLQQDRVNELLAKDVDVKGWLDCCWIVHLWQA